MVLDAFVEKKWDNLHDLDPETFRAKIGELSFSQIALNPELPLRDDLTWTFSSPEHPLVYGDVVIMGSFIGFNEEYYKDRRSEMDDLVEYTCAMCKSEHISISVGLINERNLKALAKNPNIKRLRLGLYGETYTLTVEDYNILKESGIEEIDSKEIAPELKEVYGGKISANDRRKLVKDLDYPRLKATKSIDFSEPLPDDELVNLKYAEELEEVKINNCDNFEALFKIVDRLEELGKKPRYVITAQYKDNYDYKNKFNEFIFNHLDYLDNDRIMMRVGIKEEYPLKDYVKYEKRLVEMIKPALNLSPFEKYLYAYNITKKYKEYKENKSNKDDSRHLYKILDGDYMVCVGYATLLGDLLNKLGIESTHYSVDVDVGFDKVDKSAMIIPEDVLTESAGHARVIVNIVDPKYNIDGIYIADPTWDNEMDADTYNFAFMTSDEYNGLYRANFLNFYNVDEMFFVHSLEEFYDKTNVWLDKNYRRTIGYEEKHLESNYEEFKNVTISFMKELEKFRPELVNYLNKVYANVFRAKTPPSNVARFKEKLEAIVDDIHDDGLDDKFWDVKSKFDYCTFSLKSKKEQTVKVTGDFMKRMTEFIMQIDSKFAEFLYNKYPEIKKYSHLPSEEEFRTFMFDVGNYIVNKVNKEIKGPMIRDAIREVYKASTILEGEELEKTLDIVIAHNVRRQRTCFPVRYKEIGDGKRIPIVEESNKFDMEEQNMSL